MSLAFKDFMFGPAGFLRGSPNGIAGVLRLANEWIAQESVAVVNVETLTTLERQSMGSRVIEIGVRVWHRENHS